MMAPSSVLEWKCGERVCRIDATASRVMGILNVTPDSFSDGGRFFDPVRAIEHGLRMAAEGADILDIGGESTRPGAEPVSVGEELRRVIPVVRSLAQQTKCLISIDTTKAVVAAAALEAGAHIINDVSAMTGDPDMIRLAASCKAGIVLMHMKGTPRTMQQNPKYEDVVEEVARYLEQRAAAAAEAGIAPDRLALDPGIGFGKDVDHNLALLAMGLPRLAKLGRPIVVGVSRKSFIGKITGCDTAERMPGSIAAAAYAVLRGAHIIRAHDVKETCGAMRLVDMLRDTQRRHEGFV
jgi:dihydropteroate synthase